MAGNLTAFTSNISFNSDDFNPYGSRIPIFLIGGTGPIPIEIVRVHSHVTVEIIPATFIPYFGIFGIITSFVYPERYNEIEGISISQSNQDINDDLVGYELEPSGNPSELNTAFQSMHNRTVYFDTIISRYWHRKNTRPKILIQTGTLFGFGIQFSSFVASISISTSIQIMT